MPIRVSIQNGNDDIPIEVSKIRKSAVITIENGNSDLRLGFFC